MEKILIEREEQEAKLKNQKEKILQFQKSLSENQQKILNLENRLSQTQNENNNLRSIAEK